MASSFALPASTISHHHHHGSDNACSHSHSHSHSHSSSLSSLSPSRNRKEPRPTGAQSHARNHQDDDNLSHYRANTNFPMQINVPPLLAPSTQWKIESTPGGKTLVSPTAASFDAAAVYEPPVDSRPHSHSHSHSHHHHHDSHSTPRSRFTEFLCSYTSGWPLLHTVLLERDSRRIFYFMRFGNSRFPGTWSSQIWLTAGCTA
jgi:zinc transporter 5/7